MWKCRKCESVESAESVESVESEKVRKCESVESVKVWKCRKCESVESVKKWKGFGTGDLTYLHILHTTQLWGFAKAKIDLVWAHREICLKITFHLLSW